MRFAIAVLLLGLLSGSTLAQERAKAQGVPISVTPPQQWESYPGDPKNSGEVLFLQTPEGAEFESTVSLSVYPLPSSWDDLVRRENFLMIVHDSPILENQALSLRGAKGHKWAYRGETSQGVPKLFYRLYLALPASVGPRRLLVLEGIAPEGHSSQALLLFNELARSLAWGADL